MKLEPIQNMNTQNLEMKQLIGYLNLWKDRINEYNSQNDSDISTLELLVDTTLSSLVIGTVYRLEGDANYNFRNTSSHDFVCDNNGNLVRGVP